jgi:hypothetical protein
MQDVTNPVTLLSSHLISFSFSFQFKFELLMSFQNIAAFLVFEGTLDKLRTVTE